MATTYLIPGILLIIYLWILTGSLNLTLSFVSEEEPSDPSLLHNADRKTLWGGCIVWENPEISHALSISVQWPAYD